MRRHDAAADALVVGLGNPGAEYDGTRHNLGFAVVDALAARHAGSWRKSRQRALVAEISVGGVRTALAKPQTYMNLSGESVKALLGHHGTGLDGLCVVYDELDLPLGTVRLKAGGGTAGHNGMRSVTSVCGKEFVRVRLGIGRPPGRQDPAAYVLRRFRKDELDEAALLVERGADVVESWLVHGTDATQNTFHTA